MRERMAQPKLTNGICADQAWAKAPCMKPELTFMFDLELDVRKNGHRWCAACSREDQRRRYAA